MENNIKAEIDYIVNTLGKRLVDSDECDMTVNGYRRLAKKYFAEEYASAEKEGIKLIVHHIDFNHWNNIASNLVVLTNKEHRYIHEHFDPNTELKNKRISKSNTGKVKSKENIEKLKKSLSEYWSDQNNHIKQSEKLKRYYESVGGEPEEVKAKVSASLKQYYKENDRNEEHCKNISESLKGIFVGWHWYKDKETGKRVWWKLDTDTNEIIYK